MRDDPFAEQAAAVGARASVHASRFEDRIVVPRIYPLLESAQSLKAFHDMTVEYADGRRGSLREVADRARKTLDKAEAEYVDFVHRVWNQLTSDYGYKQALELSGADYVRYIDASARILVKHYLDDGVVVEPGAAFSAIFLHVGYVLSRIRFYMKRDGGGRLSVDPNDMEDAAILLHLDLTEPRTLVTNDGNGAKPGTIHAVNEALSNLRTAAEELGTEVVALPRIMTVDQFRAMLVGTPAGREPGNGLHEAAERPMEAHDRR